MKQNNDIHNLHKEGFEKFHEGLEEFLTENEVTFDRNFGYFKIYSNASVESTDIIWTSGSFYGNEWFSDVAVSSEETEWYGKVLIVFLIIRTMRHNFLSHILLLTEFYFRHFC
jgi:hypothetical protein